MRNTTFCIGQLRMFGNHLVIEQMMKLRVQFDSSWIRSWGYFPSLGLFIRAGLCATATSSSAWTCGYLANWKFLGSINENKYFPTTNIIFFAPWRRMTDSMRSTARSWSKRSKLKAGDLGRDERFYIDPFKARERIHTYWLKDLKGSIRSSFAGAQARGNQSPEGPRISISSVAPPKWFVPPHQAFGYHGPATDGWCPWWWFSQSVMGF